VKVAFVGTRGIPARYGGFETAVEEISTRLVDDGIEAVVYCRNDAEPPASHRGVSLVHLPAIRRKSLETISHTFLSVLHLLRHPVDAVLLFNGANSVFVPLLRARGMPVAVHVDGLEWKRAKWSWPARQWHRFGERAAVWFGSAVIADAPGIARYYRDHHDADTVEITYGAPVLRDLGCDRIGELGLEPDGYHLVVARLEPENNVEIIVAGYTASDAEKPLVVVGDAAFGGPHARRIHRRGRDDARVRFVGAIWDQDLLNQLYANALTYLHGHSVGGTNPSLLRAMGAGAPVVAFDVDFNRDVVGASGLYFRRETDVAAAVERAEADLRAMRAAGAAGQAYVQQHHRWDDVARGYAQLCRGLVAGRPLGDLSASG
jgi:glycosyltransferase involved in cell wall biosynthesis